MVGSPLLLLSFSGVYVCVNICMGVATCVSMSTGAHGGQRTLSGVLFYQSSFSLETGTEAGLRPEASKPSYPLVNVPSHDGSVRYMCSHAQLLTKVLGI